MIGKTAGEARLGDEMPHWEVRGVGYVDPQLVSGATAINPTAEGTSVIGTWEPGQVIGVVLALIASGFELVSVRRLGASEYQSALASPTT
jgi:hypothetical protein